MVERTPPGSATELAEAIRSGETCPIETVDACLERIEQRNNRTNAFVDVYSSDAREKAKEAAAAVDRGDSLGPLHGVPIAIKDLFDLKADVRCTFGSIPFESFVPKHTSTHVARLERAGAIVVGKTNTSEFGHSLVTDNRLFGPTSTPFDLERNAGGSSGGSAAAVADGLVPIAQGSDAGGSVRVPAACCGVVGVKPTFGLVAQPMRPDAFLADTPFVHVGPIARTVQDAATMLSVLVGPDPADPFSVPTPDLDLQSAPQKSIDGFTIGYLPTIGDLPVTNSVAETTESAVQALVTAGATVERATLDLDLDHAELSGIWRRQMGTLYHSVLEGFAAGGTDVFQDRRPDLTPSFRDMLTETADRTALELKRDDRKRTRVYDAIQSALSTYDLLVTPTTATTPPENNPSDVTTGPDSLEGVSLDPLTGWCLTHPLNFTGHPAASVPAGETSDGLPVGLQIVGDRFEDDAVLAAAGALERHDPWIDSYPDE
ncbi:amidase [Natrarchaeobius chitinivorans]|uniref:Amidase n=1 Tax=Natrarchaeobius chitinivorans TaxID=1679083 RepID=A0A3N6LV71_NATCH|nr:amidase [Natrarchaeobius chitinivorans]RQG94253.1 amidase [Natrarchaeobius chitinivorans]